MKSLKEIENIGLEELESVSHDETISVPEDLTIGLEAGMDVLLKTGVMTSAQPVLSSRGMKITAIAASAAIVAGVCFALVDWSAQPKDTFDDPYLAYAELEKAFAIMSDGIRKGVSMAEESEAIIARTTSVFSE